MKTNLFYQEKSHRLKICFGALIVLGIYFLWGLTGCDKDYINPNKPLPNGTILHMEENTLPNVWNPFKVTGNYFSDLDGYYRYYVVSNNGVFLNCPASDLDKAFSNNDKKCERKTYTWDNGRCYNPYGVDITKPITFIHCDSLGHNYGNPFPPDQLPKPL